MIAICAKAGHLCAALALFDACIMPLAVVLIDVPCEYGALTAVAYKT
jgi:hypothetical protein